MYVTYNYDLPVATCATQDVWQKTKRYSRLVGQTILFALTTIFLFGQLYKNFPKEITKNVLVLLSAAGFIFMPYVVDLIAKTSVDAHLSYRTGQHLLTSLSVGHTIEMTSSTALAVASLSASCFGAAGKSDTQMSIYRYMTPFGEVNVILGVVVTLAYFVVNYLFIKNVDRERKLEIAQALETLRNSEMITPDVVSALQVRFCMDKDTLEKLLCLLDKIRDLDVREKLISIAFNNIDTQLKWALGGQLFLTLAGYGCLAIEKYATPNSVISAGINFTMSLAYLVKMYVETFREVDQRAIMDNTTEETIDSLYDQYL